MTIKNVCFYVYVLSFYWPLTQYMATRRH